ncbi:HD domain-containing protein [Clostridium sp. A1-XYC3]|uniref:HD domain-containing protein n=1 Tax=Clostridium tanneri TaxID=3037988 RepID=A0ABU4JRB2_9CLOT|nr:HD domain-containing protein [Clostridium sp. A1-XYC3]MDW8800519.1 HD domain-containing protein [Clostridium sp. A1-XYC3]
MEKINILMPQGVKIIIDTLKGEGYKGYIVGGCVRDSLLKKHPKDWDITTDSLPEKTMEIFKARGFRVVETGLKHGTVTIVINKIGYEVTTFRIEGGYSDNRHPDYVSYTTSIKEDLSRRDFTVNAMAYNEDSGLIDYFGGTEDLNNKIIKTVGKAEDRFNEDALRMLRAVRFSSQLGFQLDTKDLFISIKRNAELIKNISQERIREELSKILVSDEPVDGIIALKESGLLQYIIPELNPTIDFEQHNKHHDKDVFNHTLAVLDNVPNKLELRLAALLHDIGKPKCFTIGEDKQGHFYGHNEVSAQISRKVLKRLRFDNKTINKVSLLVFEHMSKFDKIKLPAIKRFINRVGEENLEDLFQLQIADVKGSAKRSQDTSKILDLREKCEIILNEKQPLTIKDLAVNGGDLMNLGIKEGKEVGTTLNMLLEKILERPELNTKESLSEIILKRRIEND